MRNHTLLLRDLLAASFLMPTLASGQSDDVQWYAVEIVLFDQRGAVADDGERWPVTPPLPAADNRLVGIDDTDSVSGFRSLSDDARQLNGIRRKLANTGGYEVLAHVGWRQPGLARDAAPGVALPLDWRPADTGARADRTYDKLTEAKEGTETQGSTTDGDDGLNPFKGVPSGTRLFGTIRAYRERYLHVALDLRFSPDGWDRAMGLPATGNDSGATNGEAAADGSDATTADPMTYVIRQKRRLRSSELHYLDHPIVGMVATIEPVETPDDAETPPPQALPEDN